MAGVVSTDLSVRSESVQRLYGLYLADRFQVNRRYQRKLVWSVEEKQRLIDSILRDLPIPLFLVAEIGAAPDAPYELIDGMQRLNAIFSFLENEFPVSGEYFDLDALADTKLRKDNGELTQQSPLLPRETSVQLANYTMALSVFRAPDSASVDEVFRRINSGGRRLSRQELRQAGTTSRLSDLVRIVSSRVRGDTSPKDAVGLKSMPQLSISNRELPYGVQVDDIFWVKQGILRREDVRQSQDEQVVLDLLIDAVIEPMPTSGTNIRDDYYNFSSDTADDDTPTKASSTIEHAIDAYGSTQLENAFMRTYDEIREILSQQELKFSSLIGAGSGGRSPRYFHAVFMAVFELLFRERMSVRDYQQAASRLSGIGQGALSVPAGGGDWSKEAKRQSIDAVKGVLRNAFEEAGSGQDLGRYGWASQLETLLSNALVEQQLFDCKQGLLLLNDSRDFDSTSFGKVCRTLSAMANVNRGAVGYVAVGIADDEQDADRVRTLDKVDLILYRNFYVVGLEREAAQRGQSLNDYWTWLVQRIRDSKLDPKLARYVAGEARLINYRGRAVALLKVEAQESPSFYDGKLFERSGSETIEVPQQEYMRIFARFVDTVQ
jgi:hypothetical protein